MLKILDRYIISKFLKTFFFTALIFSLIALVIDLSEKVNKFISKKIPLSEIFGEYYLNFIPWINSVLWPLFALIAVIFFTSRMAKNSEIISILNAGVSYKRILVPYMVAASVLFLFHLTANHFILPKGTKVLREFENKYLYLGNDQTQTSNIHFFIAEDSKVFIRYYNRRDTSASNFRLENFENGKIKSILKARTISYKEAPNIWTLRNYQTRIFDDKTERIIKGSTTLDTVLNIDPKDFIKYSNQKDMMSTKELMEFIASEKKKGVGATKKYEAEIHRRTSEPFTIILLTIIGVAIASRKVRGGVGLHIAIGVVLGAVYILLSKFAFTFAQGENVSTLLGMWIPNIIFTFVALYLVFKAQK